MTRPAHSIALAAACLSLAALSAGCGEPRPVVGGRTACSAVWAGSGQVGELLTQSCASARCHSSAAAAGGYDVPAGLSPLTQLHASEMVLPADIAGPLRDQVKGGGMGGDVHLHVTAMDAKGVKDFLMGNRSAVAAAVRGAMRDGMVGGKPR